MRTSLIASGGLLLLVIGGCAKNGYHGELTGASAADAAGANADQRRFERAGDPPLTADTHFAAGQLAESQRNLATAVEQYRKAVRLDPKHRAALFRLGVLYAQQKQYPQAIATWTGYLEATGGSATGYSNLGFCQELAGKSGEAEASYKKGIVAEPADGPCRVNYGLMLARQGRTNEAILQLRAVLTEAEVHYNLGSVHEQQGAKDQARAEYRKAIELDPHLDDAKLRLAALE